MTEMSHIISSILDFLTIIVIALPILRGYRRGFKRCILSLISLAVSAAVAYTVSGILTEPVYERYLSDSVSRLCSNAVSEFNPITQIGNTLSENGISVTDEQICNAINSGGNISESVSSLATSFGADEEQANALAEQSAEMINSGVPDAVKQAMPSQFRKLADVDLSDAQINDAVRAYAQSADDAADYIETNYAAPLCKAALKVVIFLAALIAMSLVMALAFRIFGFDLNRRATSFADRIGGGLIGAVKAAANVIIVCMVAIAAEKACGGMFGIESLNSVIFLPIFNMLY